MKRPDSVKCENCIFGEKDNKFKGIRCRFFPPNTVIEENDQRIWKHPLTNADTWCGQFKPKDNLTAVEWVAWMKGLDEDVKA